MKKVAPLLLTALFLLSSSGCELRNTNKQRQKEADEAAQRSRDEDKKFQQQDASEEMRNFTAHRNYFVALQGDYIGHFVIPKDPADERSKEEQTEVTVHIEMDHDLADFAGTPLKKPDEIRAQTDKLSFSILVTESRSHDPIKSACSAQELRPDDKDGTFAFECHDAVVGGKRDYTFWLDDSTLNPNSERTTANIANVSANVSADLREGKLSVVNQIYLGIVAFRGNTFFVPLHRKTPGKI
jgi:hypothetical protein